MCTTDCKLLEKRQMQNASEVIHTEEVEVRSFLCLSSTPGVNYLYCTVHFENSLSIAQIGRAHV
jgi:hypothetical protein